MELELTHIAPYLPYGLMYQFRETGDSIEMYYHSIAGILNRGDKIYLRPLSDLIKEIEHNRERFVPFEKLAIHLFDIDMRLYLKEDLCKNGNSDGIPFWVSRKLFEWHFDVFGLIDKGLAINKTQS